MNAVARFIDRYPAAALLFVTAVLCIAGTMDFNDAKAQEKVICARAAAPSWCKDIEK